MWFIVSPYTIVHHLGGEGREERGGRREEGGEGREEGKEERRV